MTTKGPRARILIVDDDPIFRHSMATLLQTEGYAVETAANAQQGVATLRASHFELMLLDVKMPGTDGITMVESLRRWGDGIPVLMISGYGTVSDAVRALHVGADDFLTKPVEPELLFARVSDLLERRPVAARAPDATRGRMIGRSALMLELFASLHQVAPTESTVLITGETGTGKELAAAAIHAASPRRTGPFVAVDCGALSDGLLESELFGHVRGAFTGAVRDKAGLFEVAADGTLFLDEIGSVSVAMQQRLLRALQERETTRVGATRPTKSNVRVIAATNRDLRADVQSGQFREDLFYRLNVFPIVLPPLRRRRGDIPLLVEHALAKLGRADIAVSCCSPLAMRLLLTYDWPGNVRELFSVVESASIRAGNGRIEPQHLPVELRAFPDAQAAHHRYRATETDSDERDAIVSALEQSGGVIAHAATLLGMGRTTLWRKLKAHNIAIVSTADSDIGLSPE